nr:hypothetical protein [uncultured Roseateles sp.]
MLKRPYKFAHAGIHVVEYQINDPLPPEVLAQAKKDGVWVETPAEPKVETPAEPKVETPAEPKVDAPTQPAVKTKRGGRR